MKKKNKQLIRDEIKEQLIKYAVVGNDYYYILISPDEWHKIFKTKS